MKSVLFCAGCSLLALAAPLSESAIAVSFDRMYVFGDSLSDTGNVSNVTRFVQTLDPSTSVQPPSPPYFQGRYSNGPLWVDYLADAFDVDLVPSSTLAFPAPITVTPSGSVTVNENFVGQTVDRSVNFAFGGAQSGLNNAVDPRLPGILRETNAFLGDHLAAGARADEDALYVVWAAGANDYQPSTFAEPDKAIASVMKNITQSITTLFDLGARNFLIPNAPNLGLTPLALAAGPQVSGLLTDISKGHNALLQSTLTSLGQSLTGAKLVSLDINGLLARAIADPGRYGFVETQTSCLNQVTLAVCDAPDQYLFWDGIHPSGKAHQVVSEFALATLHDAYDDGSVSVPEPEMGWLGAIALGGWLTWRRRRSVAA
ncbi:SGNH/GDSL hydrolase family protein [Geitlerinema sp. PCC 7407]|uniref:SGNH/GDSL hydrolase family protein n=1 Tax=Geitlerinema sp. PCC 7407 TaxID=1173025 RepID=UPI00029FCCF5|nr:SGNH/GDSL hydrolase family protein [Geitlerinema sp. PCC 7407]AFY66924.1 lipolytic protein G-D-S-L family [Geitlerinema sp. PCC 7407]